MVRDRRYGRTLMVLLIIVTLAGTAIFVSTLFAQDDDAPEEIDPASDPAAGDPAAGGADEVDPTGAPEVDPGGPPMDDPGMIMDPGMMGGMGMPGMGMGAAAASLVWTEEAMPEELVKTYSEYCAETGQGRVLIPDVYLFDADDETKKYTDNQWAQLQRIYAGKKAGPEAVVGRPGNALSDRVTRVLTVKENELATVRRVYEQGLDNFSFRVGFPQMELDQINPGTSSVTIEVGVIMSVKPNVAKRYPTLVYRALKKFDNYGTDRDIFRIVDYEGGMWNPKQIRLWSGAISEWERLWGANEIVLNLYDVDGDRVVTGRQSAQHTGGICAKLVHPDELNYAPMFETLMPAKDYTFEGGKLNLDYSKGWYYSFSFSIPVAQLAGLDRAEVQLLGADGLEGSSGRTQAAPSNGGSMAGGSSRDAAAAGADQAMDRARTGLPMMGQTIAPGFY